MSATKSWTPTKCRGRNVHGHSNADQFLTGAVTTPEGDVYGPSGDEHECARCSPQRPPSLQRSGFTVANSIPSPSSSTQSPGFIAGAISSPIRTRFSFFTL